MRNIIIGFMGLSAVSCGQNSAPVAGSGQISISETHEVSATSDLETPGHVTAITFVPNTVATWLSGVVLLMENGDLYRTDAGSSKPVKIDGGDYSDILGLQRQAQPGVFLALNRTGSLSAFIEVDEDGNFGPIPLSSNTDNIAAFCTDSSPQSDFVWAMDSEGNAQKLIINIQENKAVEITRGETVQIPDGKSCTLDDQNAPLPSTFHTITALPGYDGDLAHIENGPIILTKDGDAQGLKIINGLSVQGVDEASYVAVTGANLGSTFNSGALVAVDSETNRLVFVSRDYLLREITGE